MTAHRLIASSFGGPPFHPGSWVFSLATKVTALVLDKHHAEGYQQEMFGWRCGVANLSSDVTNLVWMVWILVESATPLKHTMISLNGVQRGKKSRGW